MTPWPTDTAREPGTHVLMPAEDNRILFHCVYHQRRAEGFSYIIPQLYAREEMAVGDWPLRPAVDDLSLAPMELSACICASTVLLFLNHSKNRVYDDQQDMAIPVRELIQGHARRFGVDPSEMMKHYDTARIWLGIPKYTHPLTVDELIGNLERQGKAEVTK